MYCHTKLVLVAIMAMAISAAPQLPPGIDAAICPNYPFCGPSPQGAPGSPSAALAAHAAAEAAVRALQAQGPGVVGASGNIGASGIVGASGNIGPSGLCGPSGCIAF
eukprot:TRINITY_DN70588_c0_g1_i1.p1 TRINITY_DN70588_c0_g1~~TRINITY_DN70588_c0_g1_i1.p1  ORF type:complete len:107 (-),score=37.09 TRINITY_DN70588_c0_g1_i1:30-350(-)